MTDVKYEKITTSHELAAALLSLPNMPLATHASGRTARSNEAPWLEIKVGTVNNGGTPYIIVGDWDKNHYRPIKAGKIWPYDK